jgi:AcrR family transcriptional regulator
MAPRPNKSATHKFHQRRDTIVRAAVEVLNHKGVRGMTLADVAARIDLVPTAVMYYFRKKEELAAACFPQSDRAVRKHDRAGAARPVGARGARALRRVLLRVPPAGRGRRGGPDRGVQRRARRAGPGRRSGVHADVPQRAQSAAQVAGDCRLPRMDCNARTHLLLAQLFWSDVWVPRYYVEDYPRLADHMLDIFENGLLRGDGAWQPRALRDLEPPPADGSSEARETFLQAATSLMNDHGYRGASVQKIPSGSTSPRARSITTSITKDDLILACFERTLAIVRRAQDEGARGAGNGAETLVAVAAALVEHQLSGKAPLLRTSALTSVPQEIRADLVKEFDRASGRFSLVFSEGIADGSLRPVDAAIAAQMITALINARRKCTTSRRASRSRISRARTLDRCFRDC